MKRGSTQPPAARIVTRRYALYSYIAVFFLCIGAGFVLYGNSLGNEFVFDDLPLIVENKFIQDIGNLWQGVGLVNGEPMYRPVRYVSYMLDYQLWGLNPAGYHGANIVYHSLCSFILYLVLLELLGSRRAAAAAGALIYLSHPVLTDSVAYISGRRDVLVGLFYLLSFYYFVRYRKEPRWRNAVLTGIFFLLALGSKEMGITLPAVCLLYDFTGAMKQRHAGQGLIAGIRQAAGELVRRSWKLYLPLAAAAGYFMYSKIVLHYPSLKSSYYGGSAAGNFATVVRIICYYIKLVCFPVVLHADYSYNAFPLSQSFLEWRVAGAGLVVAGMLWMTLRSLVRQEWVFFGGMWFFITLLPVCQIFPHHELMAEHYLYVPLAGIIILVSPLLVYVMEKKQRMAQGLIMMIVVLYGLRTVERNRDWRDGMTLWSGVVKAAPESARGHDNLGTEHFKRKEYGTALKHYQEAIRLQPEDSMFHNNLGMANVALGDLSGARREFKKALDLNENLWKTYFNLATVCYFEKEYAEAAKLFFQSKKVNYNIMKVMGEKSAMAFFSYAMAVMAMDEGQFNKHLFFTPALKKKGKELGKDDFAIYLLQRAITIKPGYAKAYETLADLYRKKGDMDKALQVQRILESLKTRAASGR